MRYLSAFVTPLIQTRLLRAACARPLALALAASAAVSIAPLALGQDMTAEGEIDALAIASPLAVFEGRLVREVRLEGLERVPPQLVRNTLRTTVGRPLSLETVRRDIRNLHRLGEFRRISASAELFEDGSLAVIYAFDEAPILADIVVEGNVEIETEAIARAAAGAQLVAGAPIDEFRVDQAARAVEELYRRRGYFAAEATVDETELAETGVVVLRVREGQQARVARIDFVGNERIESRKLRPVVDTRTATWFESGPYDPRQLTDDVGAIVRYYRDRGHLDARADWRVIPSPNGREVIVEFLIEEGEQYTLRRVTAESATGEPLRVFTEEQIQALAPIRPGDALERARLQATATAIRDAFWRLGYVDARLETSERHVTGEEAFEDLWRRTGRDPRAFYELLVDAEAPQADLRVVITEGERYRTGEVLIRGNTITKGDVIRREVRVTPGEPLDRVGVELTQRRLANSRLFARPSPADPNAGAQVEILPADPAQPGYRDVLVEITETNTSSLNFGAQVNSDAGLAGFIEARFWNFDITDPPESFDDWVSGRSFRGGGQSLTLRASPGTEIQNYSIAFSDPYLFEQDLSLSTSAALVDRFFEDYDENRVSGRLALGRRFGERWVGTGSLRLDSVELSDIDADAPVDVFAVEDRNTLYGLGFSLTRTSVPADQRLSPGEGSQTELSIEQVFGDFSFTKLALEQTAFLTIGEDFLGRRQIVSTRVAARYIPQEDEAPVYERHYLGGRSFRGFDFRGVSPRGIRNNDGMLGSDPIGGEWSFFAGIQYEHPLAGVTPGPRGRSDPILSGVVFLDTGTVQRDVGFEDYRVSVGFGLRIRVPQLTSVPLAFDFGFPIVTEDGDDEQIFSFAVDLPL
jgi:outer membrane protein insertion porin family